MRASALEGAFASASDNAGTSYVPLYGHSLGATPAQIGLLVALPNLLTNVLQVPVGAIDPSAWGAASRS